MKFKAESLSVQLFHIIHKKGQNYRFLNSIRERFPDLILEGISQKCILSLTHAKKIISLSLFAQKQDLLLSKKLQTDILLRFACTTQISEAMMVSGIESENDFMLVAIGREIPKDLSFFISKYTKKQSDFRKNRAYLKKQFRISEKHLSAVLSDSPLEDLMVEKAAVLFK